MPVERAAGAVGPVEQRVGPLAAVAVARRRIDCQTSARFTLTTRPVTSEYYPHGNRVRITHPDGHFFEYAYDDLLCEPLDARFCGAITP